ncbi:hypothetical protein C1646_816596 [Rhizophagus diaphanus]|nr:hypothetical protein C1646_816596 [Rhizophagus diaphanus] [Rhizophagus sp. MUCL 43196]
MYLNQPAQNSQRKKNIYKKCNECKRKRKTLDESHQICHICHKIKILFKSSGNKVIDDFITHTQRNYIAGRGKLEVVPYDQFKNIEFIAEGGFSKVYKATWADGPINWRDIEGFNWNVTRKKNYPVVLKYLNNSKNITPKELNELKVFYQIFSKNRVHYISTYLGISQDPITKNIMIIMPYYSSGDLSHFLSRRPFWDRIHDTELIIEICDGLRPPIVTNAPEGYIELMKECWNSDPNKRPKATVLSDKMQEIINIERENINPTKIIKSSDIEPIATNNPGAIYKSRPLSGMIQSAMSTRSLRSQSITAEVGKRKFEDNQDKNCFNEDKFIKKIRSIETEENDYIKQEFELDIDINYSKKSIDDERYISQEIDFDI